MIINPAAERTERVKRRLNFVGVIPGPVDMKHDW